MMPTRHMECRAAAEPQRRAWGTTIPTSGDTRWQLSFGMNLIRMKNA